LSLRHRLSRFVQSLRKGPQRLAETERQITDEQQCLLLERLEQCIPPFENGFVPGFSFSETLTAADCGTQPFERFFQRYKFLVASQAIDEVETLRKSYPDVTDFCDKILTFHSHCDLLPAPFNHSLKRCYTPFIHFQNMDGASRLQEYSDLPCLFMFGHYTDGPTKFIEKAITGQFCIDKVDPPELIRRVWKEGVNAQTQFLREHLQSRLESNADGLGAGQKSKSNLCESAIYQAIVEMAMCELLKENRWKAIIVGTAAAPMSLAIFDIPRELRPPVLYLSHGFPYKQEDDLHNRADYTLVRGKTDWDFFRSLGTPESRLVRLGCLDQEVFPDNNLLEARRHHARLKYSIAQDEVVILYALTKGTAHKEVTALILESCRKLRNQLGSRKLTVLLKYHVTPHNQPLYSHSRNQYPLSKMFTLSEYGYSVRLIEDLEEYLPAADCMLTHESSVLYDAIGAGLPTVSIGKQKAQYTPRLGYGAYKDSSCHKFLTIRDSPQAIGEALSVALTTSRTEAWDQCRSLWNDIYDCGRTEAMVRLVRLLETVCNDQAAPLESNVSSGCSKS
jgi:hypothetical protein